MYKKYKTDLLQCTYLQIRVIKGKVIFCVLNCVAGCQDILYIPKLCFNVIETQY